jgi:hypothetical protein
MPSLPPATKIRRVASLAFGLSLAFTSLKLAGCFVNATPPSPHDTPDGDPPDPSDASDASEEPG